MSTAEDLVELLGLLPHPEGGFYVETYRSTERVGARALATAIYYLLTPRTFSALHRLASDEIFHFYRGAIRWRCGSSGQTGRGARRSLARPSWKGCCRK